MALELAVISTKEEAFEKAQTGLPRKTDSLCPECLEIIDATMLEENGKVIMKKSCAQHGDFVDIIFSNAELFNKIEKWSFIEGTGIENPIVKDAKICPTSCGLCQMHYSAPALTNVDLTNRCNLRCPFCFANANVADYVYEPSLDEIRKMLERSATVRPRREQAVQFSGGEPTLSPHFVEACRIAKKLGFARIQAATNGITFAKDFEFAQRAREAGLDTLYLQFDGTDENVYKETRQADLWEIKQKCFEVARKLDIVIVLVPTIVKTINDNRIGEIVQFAIDNVDIVPGISFQPVCFTGRIDQNLRLKQRFTLSDLAFAVEEQTGYAKAMRDWYPISMMNPLIKFMDPFLKGDRMNMLCSCHTNCGIGTFLFVNRTTKEVIPIAKIFDIEKAFTEMMKYSEQLERKPSKIRAALYLLNIIRKYYSHQPDVKLNKFTFLKIIDSLAAGQMGFAKKEKYDWRMIFCAGMHFQDAFNYNVERVKRCVIHYSAPNGRMYPFCTYNSGPFFRAMVEREYSVPKEIWLKTRGSTFVDEGFFGKR